MPKGDNMTPRGQRKARLKKILLNKDGETALQAAAMLALMDGDLSTEERARYERIHLHLARRVTFEERSQPEAKEHDNLFA